MLQGTLVQAGRGFGGSGWWIPHSGAHINVFYLNPRRPSVLKDYFRVLKEKIRTNLMWATPQETELIDH